MSAGYSGSGRDPIKRRAQDEISRRKRRARLAGVAHEPYTLAEIAERDGFICWLCGDSVDMSLRFPDSSSASIDHVLPVSLGGDDIRANVKLAHFGENASRGNMEVSAWRLSKAQPAEIA